MPAYDSSDDPLVYWDADEEASEPDGLEDDAADIYLRVEEVWPHGVNIRIISFLLE